MTLPEVSEVDQGKGTKRESDKPVHGGSRNVEEDPKIERDIQRTKCQLTLYEISRRSL